jgi:hypothetical protein
MSDSYAKFEEGESPKVITSSERKKKALFALDILVLVFGVFLFLLGACFVIVGVVKYKGYNPKNQPAREVVENRLFTISLAAGGGLCILNSVLAAVTVLFCHRRTLVIRQLVAVALLIGMILLMMINCVSIVVKGVMLFKYSSKTKGITWFAAGLGAMFFFHGGFVLILFIRLLFNKLWKK